jgi:hypothetical protein
VSAVSDVARVVVTKHARQRYRARLGKLPESSVAVVVQGAFREGRWSRRRPAWVGRGGARSIAGQLYAWPPDRSACFVLHEGADAFVLTTVMSRADAAAHGRVPTDRTSRTRRVSIKRSLEGLQ